jgi:hypothetical protein
MPLIYRDRNYAGDQETLTCTDGNLSGSDLAVQKTL